MSRVARIAALGAVLVMSGFVPAPAQAGCCGSRIVTGSYLKPVVSFRRVHYRRRIWSGCGCCGCCGSSYSMWSGSYSSSYAY